MYVCDGLAGRAIGAVVVVTVRYVCMYGGVMCVEIRVEELGQYVYTAVIWLSTIS